MSFIPLRHASPDVERKKERLSRSGIEPIPKPLYHPPRTPEALRNELHSATLPHTARVAPETQSRYQFTLVEG